MLQNLPEWMTGGRFGPEASLFAVVVDLLLVLALWKWKGSVSRPMHSSSRVSDASLTLPH
jgi:hypothetical protein